MKIMVDAGSGVFRACRFLLLRLQNGLHSRDIKMNTTDEFEIGRIMVLRCNDALDGSGPTPEQITTSATRRGTRYLLLDTTRAAYADSGGLRWLLRLRHGAKMSGKRLRVVARPGSKVRRNIQLLGADLEVYDSVAHAWKTPWETEVRPAMRRATAAARA